VHCIQVQVPAVTPCCTAPLNGNTNVRCEALVFCLNGLLIAFLQAGDKSSKAWWSLVSFIIALFPL